MNQISSPSGKAKDSGKEKINPSPPPVQFNEIEIPDRHYHHDSIEGTDTAAGLYELDDEELSGRTGVDDEDQTLHPADNADQERRTQDEDDD